MDLLKKKGLDVHSELPQQMQNRSKYMNTSNAFNPGWNNNQQQIVGNRNKLYAGRHSDNKMRKKGSVTGRPSYGGIRHPPPPPVLDLRWVKQFDKNTLVNNLKIIYLFNKNQTNN